jgi:hypothetical protein
MLVGLLLSLLATKGIKLDAETAANLGALLTALFGSLYYAGVRLWEKQHPAAGLLLGVAAKPVYSEEN